MQVQAQTYRQITHLQGAVQSGSNAVTVMPVNNPKTGGGLCGINDYWIGHKANNGYTFSFGQAVELVRIRLTAINRGEIISISVNDKPYSLKESEVAGFDGTCFGVPKPDISDGELTCFEHTSNAEVVIRPGGPIHAVTITHKNGKETKSGVVFDIAYADEGKNSMTQTGGGAITNINSATLLNGSFSLLPNPTAGAAKISLLPTSSGIAYITVTDAVGRKIQAHTLDCTKGKPAGQELNLLQLSPGNYMVELRLNETTHVEKLVKL
jgi:hypothetical protein